MRLFKTFFILFGIIFAINFGIVGEQHVSADDDFEEYYENHHSEEDSPLEEAGELGGWGTFIGMIVAGLIFPIRKLSKSIITNFPNFKTVYISISKFVGKFHIPIGVIVLLLSIFHGIAMYVSEGELEGEGLIGLATFIVILSAAIFGAILNKSKKTKLYRTTHRTLIVIAFLFAAIHIVAS